LLVQFCHRYTGTCTTHEHYKLSWTAKVTFSFLFFFLREIILSVDRLYTSVQNSVYMVFTNCPLFRTLIWNNILINKCAGGFKFVNCRWVTFVYIIALFYIHDLVTSRMWSSHTFTRVERVSGESRRTSTPEAAFVVVTLRVFAARRSQTFVHIIAPGAIRIARVPFRTFTVVSSRKVCAQTSRTTSVW